MWFPSLRWYFGSHPRLLSYDPSSPLPEKTPDSKGHRRVNRVDLKRCPHEDRRRVGLEGWRGVGLVSKVHLLGSTFLWPPQKETVMSVLLLPFTSVNKRLKPEASEYEKRIKSNKLLFLTKIRILWVDWPVKKSSKNSSSVPEPSCKKWERRESKVECMFM